VEVESSLVVHIFSMGLDSLTTKPLITIVYTYSSTSSEGHSAMV
jgi:hypothetical protein